MNKQKYSASDVIFLLGAGATVDAGMPTVKDLTHCIRERLSHLGFNEIFDMIAEKDEAVKDNYENFFEYVDLISRTSRTPENKLFCIRMSENIIEKVRQLPFSLGSIVKAIFNDYQKETKPEYLSHLRDFIPVNGNLKVFTLNYDLCVETACRNGSILYTTGFESESGAWNPSLFHRAVQGINLYKLHGSLLWFTDKDWTIQELHTQPENPEIVLGPGNKIQADDPFLTLFYEFSRATQEARVCIVIGYGYEDTHINAVLKRGKFHTIIDVNVGHAGILDKTNKTPILISGTAKEIFENGQIKKKLEEVLENGHKKL
jgi:hypothetical protein